MLILKGRFAIFESVVDNYVVHLINFTYRSLHNPITVTKSYQSVISRDSASCNSRNRISLHSFYPIKNARRKNFDVSGVSKWHGNEMEKGENIQSRGELVYFQLSRVALRDTLGSRDTRSFRLLRGPSETRSQHRFPHVAILAFKSSDLFVVYLSNPIYDTCIRRPTSRRRRRFAQLNTIRSVFCFSFFFPLPPLNLFYGLQRACGRSTYTMLLARRAFLCL